MALHAVIMAGGSGTRFWPESRQARPKQLLPLVGDQTMIQSTVARLDTLVPDDAIMVVTNQRLVAAVAEQLPNVPTKAILGEPCRRDTAPCIGLAAALLVRTDPDAMMLVLPSDHVIEDAAAFRGAVRVAEALIQESPSRLVTFGIRPTYPAESFGYVERGAELKRASSNGRGPHVFRVAKFREKPPKAVAQEYLDAGTFYWNSGIFVWRARTILEALREREPELVAQLETIAAAADRADFAAVLDREFAAIRGISIDYAVMEHARDVVVVEAPFAWDDVGSWQSIARLSGVGDDGNSMQGRHLGLETSGTIVRTTEDHLVVTMGIKDCIVVHTPDATLVANKHQEESIRKVVELLDALGWNEYL